MTEKEKQIQIAIGTLPEFWVFPSYTIPLDERRDRGWPTKFMVRAPNIIDATTMGICELTLDYNCPEYALHGIHCRAAIGKEHAWEEV